MWEDVLEKALDEDDGAKCAGADTSTAACPPLRPGPEATGASSPAPPSSPSEAHASTAGGLLVDCALVANAEEEDKAEPDRRL